MANKTKSKIPAPPPIMPLTDKKYKSTLRDLQIELVKLQRSVIKNGQKILIIFEGRDAAGKDGTIKRLTEHMSPRETRVVALRKPSDKDRKSWYFQRYVPHLPAEEEIVIFNRSWYNRAGVEPVMGFCTPEQHNEFLNNVPRYEAMLRQSGIHVVKYYLDITRDEQKKRLDSRLTDPLKHWKTSAIDRVAVKKWHDYTRVRDEMFARTHHALAPWHVVRANNKRVARINLIKHFLSLMSYPSKDTKLTHPDPLIVFPYSEAHLDIGMIAQ